MAKALAPARENGSRSPASRRTGPAHPGQSLPTAIKGPITADSLLAVQRTAGNRAAAALVTVQADSAKPATATITHDSVYSEHFKLITDIGLLNQQVMSSIRSHWLESLSRSMAPLRMQATSTGSCRRSTTGTSRSARRSTSTLLGPRKSGRA